MNGFKFYAVTLLLLLGGALVYLFAFHAADSVIIFIRLQKLLAACLCGAALAAAGVMLQNLLMNPLADPYILGASSGGALGAILAGFAGLAYYSVPFYLLIICGCFLASIFVCSLGRGGKDSTVKIILAGVAVNIFLGSLTLLLMLMFRQSYFSTLGFMLGTLTERPFYVMVSSACIIVAGLTCAFALARSADILSFGEDTAQTLGADVKYLRYGVLFCVALLVSGAIGLGGVIGFVGLMTPHIARISVGPRVKNLLPASVLLGPAFLVNVELFNRVFFYPAQMPAGLLCALAGGPFFLWILFKNKDEYF